MTQKIRQPIVTIAGHVDHGKTSILDCFRDSCVQEGEAGGITQKISFTKYPLSQMKKTCPLIEKNKVGIEIPGFLFIDTPGHAAFTNLRKRGGSLADLAIVVVDIKEGIKPQTAEVFDILKASKTPFLIALNKIDTVSGWQKRDSVKESVETQAVNVSQEFQQALLTFQGALQSRGFENALYWEVEDFTKEIALVPCSAKTKEGISELLFVLCGLCQKFLKQRLELGEIGKGVVLEVKREKSRVCVEAILYDGGLKIGDEIAIASFEDEPIVAKVRGLDEIEPLCFKYKGVKNVEAATGVRLNLSESEGIVSGMPFQKITGNLVELKKEFKQELKGAIELDKEGIIAKADSLGSLEALLTLLRQENIKVVKAGIGNIGKSDVVSGKAILENDPLNAVIVGFNVDLDSEEDEKGFLGNVKFIGGEVVYDLIEKLQLWRKEKSAEIERERLLGLANVCKLEILEQYVFRNSNPAIFGVRVVGGKVKKGIQLIDEKGESVAKVKSLQLDKAEVDEAGEGSELAISLPGVNFERRLKNAGVKFLYADMGAKDFKKFKKNKDLLSSAEMQVLEELARVKQF